MPTHSHGKQPKFPPCAHHKPSGRAYVYWQGKRYYLGKYDSPESRERYARFIAELAVAPSVPAPSTTTDPGLTVVELCAAYWDFAENCYVKNGRPTDHIWMVKRAIGVVRDLYASAPAAGFGPRSLRAVQARLVEGGLCRNTVNQTTGSIRRMLKWAVSNELVPATVYQALCSVPGLRKGRSIARESRPVLPVEDHVVEATLPHLPHGSLCRRFVDSAVAKFRAPSQEGNRGGRETPAGSRHLTTVRSYWRALPPNEPYVSTH